jgi:replication-associated recombination protein RarA
MPYWFDALSVRGHLCPEVVSALQKSIRRSDQEQAVYWAVELDRSGYGAMCWRRLLIITSEDVGLADPHLPATIRALYENYKELKAQKSAAHPERLQLVHATLLLARAPKSRMVDHATCGSYGVNDRLFEIPDYALDMHTSRGRRMRRGLEHWYAEAAVLINKVFHVSDDPFIELNAAADRAGEAGVKPLTQAAKQGKSASMLDEQPEQEALSL